MKWKTGQQLAIPLQLTLPFRHNRIEPLQLTQPKSRLQIGDPIVEAEVLLFVTPRPWGWPIKTHRDFVSPWLRESAMRCARFGSLVVAIPP